MSTIQKKRLDRMDSCQVNMGPVEEEVDLQFVDDGDFFDGEEFEPAIESDR